MKSSAANQKPSLLTQTLLNAGFDRASGWRMGDDGTLKLINALPKEPGVYAFSIAGVVMYVGVATVGLAKRIYSYTNPGPSQITNQRINEIIRHQLASVVEIDVLIARPTDMEWNGLPVHGPAGLELGLIKAYALPWNVQSANSRNPPLKQD